LFIAIIHARVSTDEQAAEQLPIKSQIDAGYTLVDKLKAKVSQVFTEEGVSGRSMHR
jgi:DNA invertase Pin-like site-specific DNA recombinase